MIIPLPFIVSLLFTITYATDFEYTIDLARCNQDTTCFVKKSCLTPAAAETDAIKAANELKLLKLTSTDTFKDDGKCDVVIQVKVLSKAKYLFLMQITAPAGLDEAKGIVIQHADAERIACKKENDDIVHTLTPVPDPTFDFFKFEGTTSSVFGETKLFCSIFVTTTNNNPVSSNFQYSGPNDPKKIFKNAFPSLKYTLNGVEKSIEFKIIDETDPDDVIISGDVDTFWELPAENGNAKCMIELITSSDETNDDYVLKKVDLTLPSIKCSEGKLMLKRDDGKESFAPEGYVCEKKVTQDSIKYKWSPTLPKLGTVSCVMTSFCSACGDTPPSSPEDCLEGMCKAATLGTDNGCKILKCDGEDGNEWSFDGKTSAKSEGPIMCKKSSSDPTKGGWFFKGHGDDTPAEHTKIACAAIRDCIGDQFNFKCPSGLTCEGEPTFDKAIFNFTCEKGYLQKGDGNGVALETVCNRKTGKWSNLDDNANIVCAQEKKESSEGTAPKTGSSGSGPYIGAGIGGVVVLAVVGGVLYYMLIHKKKQDAKKTTKKEEGTSKKSSKKVESKSGGVGSSNEAKKEEKKSDPNKESEKPAAEAPKEAPKDGAEAAKEPPKDAAATPAAAAATPGAPPTPGAAAPATPAAGANNKQEPPTPISNITSGPDSAPAPADATPV